MWKEKEMKWKRENEKEKEKNSQTINTKSSWCSYTKSKTNGIVLFKRKSTRVKLKEKHEMGYRIPPQIPIIIKSFIFM